MKESGRWRLPALELTSPTSALVALCRRGGVTNLPADSLADFGEPAFEETFSSLAQRHGLFGLVLVALERAGRFAALPQSLAEKWVSSLRLFRRQAALWDMERNYLIGLLAERKIPAIILKGAALRLTAYTDSAERPFGDVDVLVSKADVEGAIAVLTAIGYRGEAEDRAQLYREHHHHLILRKEMGFVVEVHWALEPVRSPFRLDPAAFRNDACLVSAGKGTPVLVPCPEHMVLHLSTQNAEDGFCRLGRMVDVDRVIAGADPFDWSKLAFDAARMQVNGVLAVSLRLCEVLFATPVPKGFVDRLGLSTTSRAHLAVLDPIGMVLEQRVLQRASLERLVLLWCIQGSRNRFRVLRAINAGEYDWFGQLLPGGGKSAYGPGRRVSTLAKLGLYQLWLYLTGAGLWLRGSRRVRGFWKTPPAG